ncbi:MAG: Chemotaxis protein CheA [Candidatus Lokiarchaeum sp. GC14_75]|nr:MAG: Chemotaxis protein CheA [Candidatus Lokiarchaeum sp. GC14_75]
MATNDDIKLFISEAEDLIQKTEDEIFKLEENPKDSKPIQGLFFTFHTLKGLTAMAGFENLSKFCHHFETFLDNSKDKKVTEKKRIEFIEMLFESLDVLKNVINKVKKGDMSDIDAGFVEEIKDSFETFDSEFDITFIEPISPDQIKKILSNKQKKSYKIYIRIEDTCVFKKVRLFIIFRALNTNGQICWTDPAPESLEKVILKNEFEIYYITQKNKSDISKVLDEILEIESVVITASKADEFVSNIVKLKKKWESEQEETASAEVEDEFLYEDEEDFEKEETERVSTIEDVYSEDGAKITSVKVNIEDLEVLMNYFSELVIMKNHISQVLKGNRTVSRLIDKMDKPFLDIQEILFKLKLVRVESTFRKYKRLVRDVANETGKKIRLVLQGTNVEIDRKILEELNSPLVHLIRNAISHGIESPKERKKKGKNEIGVLRLKTSRRAGSIFIEVQDDGIGINYDKVKQKIVKKGLYDIDEVEALTKEALNKFILMAGFSTLSDADMLSGRGMGLAIVADKIKELGGEFKIESQKNEGTKFIMIVPFTRAILRAQLIQVSQDLFAIPTENIKQIYFFDQNQTQYVEGKQYYKVNSNLVPVIHLDQYLKMVDLEDTNSYKKVAILCQKDEDSLAVLVADKQLQQLDVVVKPFTSNYSDSRDVLGSSITGEGTICLILDVLNIMSTMETEEEIKIINKLN